jgi:hypothetical protein
MISIKKEMIKVRSRQHENTSQCDGPAWLTSERGVVNSRFPFIDAVSLPLRQDDQLGEVLLMSSILLGLKTKQVDYVAAIVEADSDTTGFVEMPSGFTQLGGTEIEEVTLMLEAKSSQPFQQPVNKTKTLAFLNPVMQIHVSSFRPFSRLF